MTNIAAKTLVVCRQTLTFVEYHITKESFSSRELRRYTPRISNPHLVHKVNAPIACRDSEKTDATPTRRILLSPFTDSFLSFEHEHCPTLPQSTALLRRWLPTNDLGQNPMDYHRREALRHVRRAAPFLLPTRAQRHPRSEARPRCHATFTTVNPNNQQL